MGRYAYIVTIEHDNEPEARELAKAALGTLTPYVGGGTRVDDLDPNITGPLAQAIAREAYDGDHFQGFPVGDSEALDNLAKYLNDQESWSGADACEVFAEALMATGREIESEPNVL